MYLVPAVDTLHHDPYHGHEIDHTLHHDHHTVLAAPVVTHHEGVHHEVVPTTVHHSIPAGAIILPPVHDDDHGDIHPATVHEGKVIHHDTTAPHATTFVHDEDAERHADQEAVAAHLAMPHIAPLSHNEDYTYLHNVDIPYTYDTVHQPVYVVPEHHDEHLTYLLAPEDLHDAHHEGYGYEDYYHDYYSGHHDLYHPPEHVQYYQNYYAAHPEYAEHYAHYYAANPEYADQVRAYYAAHEPYYPTHDQVILAEPVDYDHHALASHVVDGEHHYDHAVAPVEHVVLDVDHHSLHDDHHHSNDIYDNQYSQYYSQQRQQPAAQQ